MKDPYAVVQARYVTEKAKVQENLQHASSNACVRRCDDPKYLFLVHPYATKQEIASAVESIYAEQKVKVVKVNTINTKPKRRRMRGREGFRAGFKKAIVTLRPGDAIESQV